MRARKNDGIRDPEAQETGRAPSPRTPVEIVDDFVSGRRHPSSGPADEEDPGLAWEGRRPDNEEEFGRIRGFQRQGGTLAPTNSHRGRLTSWISVGLAIAGFVVAGFAVATGMSVTLLVISGILLVAALVMALAFDLFGDVVLDPPRVEPEERHDTPLHRIREGRAAKQDIVRPGSGDS